MLVVDDSQALLNAWERELTRSGKTVAKATTRQEARAIAAELRPDVAIVDFLLQAENGVGVLHDLKNLDPEMFVAIVSMHMTTALTMACVRSGADHCCTKPFRCTEIISVAEEGELSLPNVETFERISAGEFEWEHISRAVLDCGGNITRAADQLGMYRNTLRRKLEKRGLDTRDVRNLIPWRRDRS